jgi:non-ribosomal peptide synthase protein (TIGR01720 family)
LNSHAAVRDSVVIAREGENASKQLVAYFTADQDEPATAANLRSYLQEKLPDFMLPSAFVKMDRLPLNANGKVDRKALPPPDERRAEVSDATVAPRTLVEKKLAGIWKKILRLEQVSIQDNFFELGGDSILSIQISLLANQAGLKLAPKHLFQHQTIAELAAVVEAASPLLDEQEAITGPVPLTPIQQQFFDQRLVDPHHYNQAIMFELRKPVVAALLERAVRQLLVHHDALRLRFSQTDSGWSQFNAAFDEVVPFSVADLATVAEAEQAAAVEAVATRLQSSLNLSDGPLLRVALFNLGEGRAQRLLLIIHHLLVDGVSWRILLADLELAYEQLSRGEAIELPAKSTSFKRWAERLKQYAASEQADVELDHWLRQAQADHSRLPVDFAEGLNLEASAASVLLSLSAAETRALVEEAPKAHRTQINDVLLAALSRSMSRWAESRSVWVAMEGHGREEILEEVNLSRTVGWFTSLFPVRLEVEPGSSGVDTLRSIKAQLLAIPNRGIGYGVLRYLRGAGETSERLASAPPPEIVFNYLGQTDQVLMDSALLRESSLACGPAKSPKASRPYLLEIVAIIERGQFQMRWVYSQNLHKHSTIEHLARAYMEALRELIGGNSLLETASYTPADFPLVKLDQAKLDKVLSKVKWQ